MIVIEFGDYRVALDAHDWRFLAGLVGDVDAFARSRSCKTTELTSVALAERDAMVVALRLEAARVRRELTPGLVSLCKDLFDYADFTAARFLATRP